MPPRSSKQATVRAAGAALEQRFAARATPVARGLRRPPRARGPSGRGAVQRSEPRCARRRIRRADTAAPRAVPQPSLFLNHPNTTVGAYDDILLPCGSDRTDWRSNWSGRFPYLAAGDAVETEIDGLGRQPQRVDPQGRARVRPDLDPGDGRAVHRLRCCRCPVPRCRTPGGQGHVGGTASRGTQPAARLGRRPVCRVRSSRSSA